MVEFRDDKDHVITTPDSVYWNKATAINQHCDRCKIRKRFNRVYPESSESNLLRFCPECGGDDFDTLDKADVDVYVYSCRSCDWSGTSDEMTGEVG